MSSTGRLSLRATSAGRGGRSVRGLHRHCLAWRGTGSAFGCRPGSRRIKCTSSATSATTCASPTRRTEGGGVFHFCPDCGSQVFITEPADPDLIVVPVGAFADPSFPPPTEAGRPSPSSLGDAARHGPALRPRAVGLGATPLPGRQIRGRGGEGPRAHRSHPNLAYLHYQVALLREPCGPEHGRDRAPPPGDRQDGRPAATWPSRTPTSTRSGRARRPGADRPLTTGSPSEPAPLDPAVVERVRGSFARRGHGDPRCRPRRRRRRPGRHHAADRAAPLPAGRLPPRGVVVAVLDSACGCAGADPDAGDAEVLTVELKVNLLAPAGGDSLVAVGEVVRAGGTPTVCRGEAHAGQGSSECTWRRCWRRWCAGAPLTGAGGRPGA